MISQMALAKDLGEPFMAHLENLYNIPCCYIILYDLVSRLWYIATSEHFCKDATHMHYK